MRGRHRRTRRTRLLALVAVGVVALAGLAIAPMTFAAEAPRNTCPDLEVIGARGTTERPGLGIVLTPLARQITRDLPQTVRTTPLDYPASGNYIASVRQGVTEVQRVMTATAAQCPGTRFVLMGYSQGADVMGDALAGTGSRLGGRTGLPADLATRVSSVLLFGDPSFTAGEPFNVTAGRRSGIFPRGAGRLNGFADRIQSYCNANDRFCQGGFSFAAHVNYQGFHPQATRFAAARATADVPR
ncbi:cutinase family protein [Micromonospora sp. NPDC047793]|uniref:cutinase family protein n=1 Tax=unclassified Micromonospora TaxID=2617518 RepID=UPI0010350A82|nr:cutinase family protein [Verrucosispora sp. SN26_14.1]TBL42173.1 cutinase family protein [Verrucosispora sp. SN26_14.1]